MVFLRKHDVAYMTVRLSNKSERTLCAHLDAHFEPLAPLIQDRGIHNSESATTKRHARIHFNVIPWYALGLLPLVHSYGVCRIRHSVR